MTLHVEVTAQDIATGHHRSCDHCPVALATTRALRYAGNVSASATASRSFMQLWSRDGAVVTLLMPAEVKTWVAAFDVYDPVESFTFELAIPLL